MIIKKIRLILKQEMNTYNSGNKMTIENQTSEVNTPLTPEQSVAPLLGLNIVDGKLHITVNQEMTDWQALGLLDAAATLLRSKYKF